MAKRIMTSITSTNNQQPAPPYHRRRPGSISFARNNSGSVKGISATNHSINPVSNNSGSNNGGTVSLTATDTVAATPVAAPSQTVMNAPTPGTAGSDTFKPPTVSASSTSINISQISPPIIFDKWGTQRQRAPTPRLTMLPANTPFLQNSGPMSAPIFTTMHARSINGVLTALDGRSVNSGIVRYDQVVEEKWGVIEYKLLPIFNGEGLDGSVEEMNELVRNCLRSDMENLHGEIR
ncbi:hypothetical protein EV182_003535, partial [Spiromyces aspiralis]